MTAPEPNREWGEALVRTLIAAGAGRFFISPGARSTPIVAAVARIAPELAITHFDERGMSFAALGWARASGRPAVAVTTSGSAVANLHPAVIEADYGETPLILLTADRPRELHGRGANQTIEQGNLFSGSLRDRLLLDCPGDLADPARTLGEVFAAVRRASTPLRGPVHINAPFREPLLSEHPLPDHLPPEMPAAPPDALPTDNPPPGFFDEPDGVIVLGALPFDEQGDLPEILALGRALGWPVLPDPLSGAKGLDGTILHADFILHRRDVPRPKRLLHFGGPVVSKRLAVWLSACRQSGYLQVRRSIRLLDPAFQQPCVIHAGAAQFCRKVMPAKPRPQGALCDLIHRRERAACGLISSELDHQDSLSEPSIARSLAANWPSAFFLGNSMPVRDFDSFAGRNPLCRPAFGNRGASGIDGNIATIAGIALGLNQPVAGLIGDLACLHDLSSLHLLRGLPVALIIVNNNGGGIFRFVPEGINPAQRERFWETPHEMTFQHAAAQFGLNYAAPACRRELDALLSSPADAPLLIECRTRRDENELLHRRLAAAMRELPFP